MSIWSVTILAGCGTILVCWLAVWVMDKFSNPFDELSDDDIKDMDEIRKSFTDLK